MSPADKQQIEQLERDLRGTRTAYDDVDVAPDAWQRNQDLVARAGSDGRRSTLTAVAAAVVVLLVVAASWVALGGRDEATDVPGSDGTDSSDSSSGELADPVQVARVDLPNGTVTLEVGMEPHQKKGDEPSMCERLTETSADGATGSGAGRCTSKVDRADLPGVTVDYLTGGTAGLWTTMTGAVDRRAARLTMWQADGTATDLELHDLVGSDLRAFGFLGNNVTSIRPVRLVAWADDAGTEVVESVDIVRQFDLQWLPGQERGCGSVHRVPDVVFPATGDRPAVRVRASFTDAEISYTGSGGGAREVCRPMTEAPGAVVRAGDELVIVMAPEVAAVRLDGRGRLGPSGPVQPVGTTVWRATLRQVEGLAGEDTLEFLDESGAVLQRLPVKWII